jgi:hypothetical protein
MTAAAVRELPPIIGEHPRASGIQNSKPKAADGRSFTDLLAVAGSIGKMRSWLFEGAVEGSPITVWAAPEKSAKSWAMIDACVAAATGGKWLGEFACERPGPSVYCDGEYGDAEFVRRLARICRGRGVRFEDVAGKVLHYYSADLKLAHGNDAARWIAREVATSKPTLIVIDPWRNHLPGDENSATDTLAAFDVVGQFRDSCGAAIFVPHHLNKAGVQSGSRALLGRADLMFEGSDAQTVMYSARGRTVRRADPISGRRFAVVVNHTDDDDDTVAATRVGLRWEGDNVTAATLSRPATRILDTLRGAVGPMSGARLGKEAHIENGTARAKALGELRAAGLVKQSPEGWSLTRGVDHDQA